MPYTNAWSDVVPAGSVIASLIDDHIRQARLDIRERMGDLTDTGWTVDPVIPKGSSTIIVTRVHHSDGRPTSSTTVWTAGLSYVNPTNASGSVLWIMPLKMPTGGQLQSISANVNRVDALALVRLQVWKVPKDAGALIQLGTDQNAAVNGWQDLTVSGLTETVVNTHSYIAEVTLTNSAAADTARFSSLLLTYALTLLTQRR